MYCVRALFSLARQSQKTFAIPLQSFTKWNKSIIANQKYFSTVTEDSSEQIIAELCQGDPENEKKLRILMLEVEVMRQDGRPAPDNMQSRHWKHLMELPSRNQRSNYLLYLWKTEKSKENLKIKKEERRKEFEDNPRKDTREFPDDLCYGISDQSLFLRIRDKSINMFDNYRALLALQFGQSVVIDCSYEEHMVHRETLNAAKQLTFVFGDNRIHKEPFNIHLCNVNKNGEFMQQLERNIPSVKEPWFPLNIHNKSYLDIFPKEKLVYLTPHCRNELTEFDHDAVYIVGCMVDKVNNEPLSLARAKRDGLKMAKLPLDRYLEWAPGSKKNLNINHMIPILLDLQITGDWEYALRHIPRRKLMETKILAMQNKVKNKKIRDDIYTNLAPGFKKLSFKDKRQRTKKSLYNDDELF